MLTRKVNGMVNMKNSAKLILLSMSIVLLILFLVSNWYRVLFAQTDKKMAEPTNQQVAEPPKTILKSSLAGGWYSADAGALGRQIDDMFLKAETAPIDNVIALILPHAGYQYSGLTAVTAIKAIDRKYERIVVIGPSHRVPMENVLSVAYATEYQTPLGSVPIDMEFVNKLLEYPVFQNIPQAIEYEHSVQIEVPLLQHKWQDFNLVMIVAGDCSPETIKRAADILKSLVDEDTLVVVSSDFVHYGPDYNYLPFKKDIPEQLKKLNAGAYKFIEAVDCNGFLEYRRRTGATICGFIPIGILLSMLPSLAQAKLVNQTSSGEIMGDYTNSVSYLSIAFSGKWENTSKIKPQLHSRQLTEEDKKKLLILARKSILYFLRNHRPPQQSDLNVEATEAMREIRAAFVTLEKNSELRGCIGDIFPRQPLYKSVISNAINAAVNDWRFKPVTMEECNDIQIEISALTVPQPVASPNQIRIGVDGVVLNKNGRSAVFLPQVAPEQGWNTSQMLTNLSLKAGLPPDAWKENTSFLVFQAVVFKEE
jgi:AmmeMemoRadiSam system protein B/AmmeMemoRadiSam system protein A